MSSNPNKIDENNPDSLNARKTVARSLSSMKIRLINYLNKVDDGENTRFGSCNEFTMGIHNENLEKFSQQKEQKIPS